MLGKVIIAFNNTFEEVEFDVADKEKSFSDGSKVVIEWVPRITYKTKEEVDREKQKP